MRRKKLFAKGLLSLVLLLILFQSGCESSFLPQFVFKSEQVGITLGKASSLAGSTVSINNKEYQVTTGINENIIVNFSSLGINPKYKNSIIINDSIVHTIEEDKIQGQNAWVKSSFEILGLNAVKGQKLAITIKSGGLYNPYANEATENLDDFSIKNIFLTIKGKKEEIWSDQFDKYNYENYDINFCEGNTKADSRSTCKKERTFSFTIPEKYFNIDGVIFNKNDNFTVNGSYDVKIKNKVNKVSLDAKKSIDLTINHNEVITTDKIINFVKPLDIKTYNAFLDGVKIAFPFELNSGYWSIGKHELRLDTIDINGFKDEKIINFELIGNKIAQSNLDYNVYKYSPSLTLPTKLATGSQVDANLLKKIDDNYITSPFGQNSYQMFEVTNVKLPTPIKWIGKAPKNKPLVMSVYNHALSKYDVISTNQNNTDEEVILSSIIKDIKYVKDGKISILVAAIEKSYHSLNDLDITARVLWMSDTQYLAESDDYHIGLSALGDYMKNNLEINKVKYIMHTGDMVQLNSDVDQWQISYERLMKPVIDSNIPFGISTGNHDIGALKASCTQGIDCLDDNLDYSHYMSYYGNTPTSGNYSSNRSSYNLVTIDDVDFIFLHLGWGSSLTGIHVSNKDINWAKDVLSNYENRIAVITLHEYLNNKGNRTLTGEYVFNNLVKPFNNVKLVLSGHIQGSSLKVDHIDDNNDGIGDRQVIQILTDFQEVPFGATYFRYLNLDKTNNLIYFNTYSPYFKDYNFFDPGLYNLPVIEDYSLHFDFNNLGYGLKSYYFG